MSNGDHGAVVDEPVKEMLSNLELMNTRPNQPRDKIILLLKDGASSASVNQAGLQ